MSTGLRDAMHAMLFPSPLRVPGKCWIRYVSGQYRERSMRSDDGCESLAIVVQTADSQKIWLTVRSTVLFRRNNSTYFAPRRDIGTHSAVYFAYQD